MLVNRNVIDLWYTVPEQIPEDDWTLCMGWLDETEWRRARRYRFERDRRMFLVGRALLRASLSRRSGCPPAAWQFVIDSNGRPRLDPAARWTFSISHANDIVACAIGEDVNLGIDVEFQYDKTVWSEVMSSTFTESERSRLSQLSATQMEKSACTLWTLKEAYAKARGLGLSLRFDRIGFDISNQSVLFEPTVDIEPEPIKWSFLRFELPGSYCAAICWKNDAEIVLRHTTSPMAVLRGTDFS